MKKIVSLLTLICIAFNICTIVSAIAPPDVNSITILGEEVIVMQVGETITLEAVADAAGFHRAYMYWNTDDTNIVNLVGDNGTTENTSLISTATVKALNPGKAVISVYSDMYIVAGPEDFYENDSVIINVVSPEDIFVSKVEPEFIWYDMYENEEITINAVAHMVGADSAYFHWEVDDENIVEIVGNNDEISSLNSTATIKGLASGLATISVYADCSYPNTYKSVCSKIKINVIKPEKQPQPSTIRSVELKTDSEKTIHVGEEISLAAIAEQDDYRREWAYFTWHSSDESIVAVNGDNGTILRTPPISIGKIKGISEGTAIIKVYADTSDGESSISDFVTINVLPKENTSSLRRFRISSYNNDKKKVHLLSCIIDSLNDDVVLNLDDIKIPPEQSLYDSTYDLLAVLDLKSTDANNPYPSINETKIKILQPLIGGGTVPCIGKNFKVYLLNGTQKEEIQIESDKHFVEFNIIKLGKYVVYFDEYDEYIVKFYNDIPPKDVEEDEGYTYHKIENLTAKDIIIFPKIPQKEGYVFTGWKAWSGSGIYYIESQPIESSRYYAYYATWCPEAEYEPIEIQISSEENITKGKENGKKITLKTNYGIFARDEDFPAEWRSEYDAETDAETKEAMLSDWKTKWNIVGNDDIMVESAERIDDKTVELTLSGNSDDIYHASDLQVEFASYLLLPEPYEENGEWIEWDDTKIKMDSDGVRLAMYPSDNTLKVSAQRRPGGGSLRIPEEKEPQKEEPKEEEQPTTEEAPQTEEKDKTILFTVGEKKATVFGEERINDVAPLIRGDRAFLPARFVAESLGAVVTWEEENQTVIITKDDIKIVITIDAQTAMVNGEEFELDTPAFIEQDRTYTPIRFVAEKLGGLVDWKPDSQTIIITK